VLINPTALFADNRAVDNENDKRSLGAGRAFDSSLCMKASIRGTAQATTVSTAVCKHEQVLEDLKPEERRKKQTSFGHSCL
jgi:hypothetical protein